MMSFTSKKGCNRRMQERLGEILSFKYDLIGPR